MVSIVMPCYNAEDLISYSIGSVLKQTNRDWELIVADDCSTDSSREIIKAISDSDSRVQLIKLSENSGVSAARNAAIEQAKGEYIAFLDSDDLWDPEKLQVQVEFMQQNQYQLSHTAYRKIDINNKVLSKYIGASTEGVSYNSLLKHNEIGCLTAMY